MPPIPGADDFDDIDSFDEDGNPTPKLDDLEPDPEDEGDPDKAPPVDPQFDDLAGNTIEEEDDEPRRKRGDEPPEDEEELAAWRAKQSKGVQKAFDRLTAQRHRERERAERAEAEKAEMQKWIAGEAKRQAEGGVTQADARITELNAQLEAAAEAGDTKKQVLLINELTDAKLAKRTAEEQKRRAEQAATHLAQTGGRAPAQMGGANAARDAWMTQNSWFNQPGREADSDLARSIEARMIAAGSKPNTPEHWKRLTQQIAAVAPDLVGGRQPRNPPRGRGNGGGPAAPARDPGVRQKGGKVVLSGEDRQRMRVFGLDPNNPKHLAAFASNRQR
jgi:hypothetical protein